LEFLAKAPVVQENGQRHNSGLLSSLARIELLAPLCFIAIAKSDR
jgi:hypothetical protein